MRKSIWMSQLERALSREGMTREEKRTVLNYYEEMYQDKLDDGQKEEDIIKEFGFPEDVAQNVRENDGFAKPEDDKDEPKVFISRGPVYESEAYFRPVPQYQSANASQASATQIKSKADSDSNVVSLIFSILGAIIGLGFAIVLFAVGVALPVAGLAVIISSFFVISMSTGAWLIVFGIGIVVFAIGCMIFAAAIAFAKAYGKFISSIGGEK